MQTLHKTIINDIKSVSSTEWINVSTQFWSKPLFWHARLNDLKTLEYIETNTIDNQLHVKLTAAGNSVE